MANPVQSVLSFAMFDVVGSVIRFPVWWYTEGLLGVLRWAGDWLLYRWRSYAIPLWVRHFFVPMYGEYTWAGRLISVLMRGVVIFARLIAFLLEGLAYGVLIVGWLLWPPAALFFALQSFLSGAFSDQLYNAVS